MGESFISFLIIAFLVIGIGLSISYFFKDAKKEKNNFKDEIRHKFKFFFESINSLNIKFSEYKIEPDELILMKEINNNWKTIGRFYYIIKDKYEIKNNSVGEFKVHKYFIEVKAKIEPGIEISRKYENPIINTQEVKNILNNLITEIQTSTKFIDSLKIHEI